MDILHNLMLGLSVALSPEALLYCFIGVFLGTFIGVLPGLGPTVTIGMLLPITFYLDPTTSIIMLAGIYYGAQYGASTASILLNLPGTSAGAVACLDGYPMARQGRAGVALFMTTVASFIGSCIGIVLLVGLTPPLARIALEFGPAQYFALMVFGLSAAAMLVQGSPARGLVMVAFGLLIGIVGADINSGQQRFMFGLIALADGIDLVPIATGIFGVSLIIASAGKLKGPSSHQVSMSWRSMMPTREDIRMSLAPMLRGSGIGSLFGVLPGTGPTIATFIAYAAEKRVSKTPSRFGHGAIEGVVSPEAANNAASQTGFIPTLSLGIPGDPVMAVMLGALLIHGVTPGPLMIVNHAPLFWGLVVSFLVGNFLLLILNIPLVGLWVQLLRTPYGILYPLIMALVCVGVYSIAKSPFDVGLVLFFGVLGYCMILLQFEPAPLLLGYILGPMLEENLRRSLILSRGSWTIFVSDPISLAFLGLTVLGFVWAMISRTRQKRARRREEAA